MDMIGTAAGFQSWLPHLWLQITTDGSQGNPLLNGMHVSDLQKEKRAGW